MRGESEDSHDGVNGDMRHVLVLSQNNMRPITKTRSPNKGNSSIINGFPPSTHTIIFLAHILWYVIGLPHPGVTICSFLYANP